MVLSCKHLQLMYLERFLEAPWMRSGSIPGPPGVFLGTTWGLETSKICKRHRFSLADLPLRKSHAGTVRLGGELGSARGGLV